jgi:hypothetical protein
MIKNTLRASMILAFMSFVAYDAFAPANAGTGYGVDELRAPWGPIPGSELRSFRLEPQLADGEACHSARRRRKPLNALKSARIYLPNT